MGDRIAVMRAGELVRVGTAEELYLHPGELFIARMFSEINEVPLKAAKGMIATPFGDVPAPGIGDGETAVLCIRERGIVLSDPRTAADGTLAGRVLDVKFLGAVALLEVGVQGFDRPLKARAREIEGWRKGAEVAVTVARERVLVFKPNGAESQ